VFHAVEIAGKGTTFIPFGNKINVFYAQKHEKCAISL
jgi:hypothetical protein